MRDNVKGGALTETTLFVLLAVYQPNHGYGIMQFIESKTSGRLSLGAGTLYGAINTLVKKKWIVLYGEDRRKKEYIITEEGKKIVELEVKRLKKLHDTAIEIIGGISNE
ncbi:Transcriptional regulator PadR-like family protein [Clostridium liquoris]|uniref:Transcriptional regulator PadR-like family protein n=1 Tax=Clostridium liquoris TaxID=1289519 RepID=A0A2T0B2L8_9CLOT|nr:PadR family transcriptional regulator [Clostridium liquoris]PRR78125.1 Transcriptional regulator PadR-like family protein [Clostridium liquoris]